jgi:hypothetical protein
MGAESERIKTFGRMEDGLRHAGEWYRWGPYVSERQWGTVREDYSHDGNAWESFTHDEARSRTYRWGEDGLAGFCDVEQRLCLTLALWNGNDPILKERLFGLAGSETNHGEDAKEYWWYTDAIPSHTWNSWRYHYPQNEFPYSDLVTESKRRSKKDPEYELLDTGIFDDDNYWIVEVDYAKADADDILMTVRLTNASEDAATLHVLPTVFFRNTWSWDEGSKRPQLRLAEESIIEIDHPFIGQMELVADAAPDGSSPSALFCDNDTNVERLYNVNDGPRYPKDGINDHVVNGAESVNPERVGTKASFHYKVTVDGGATTELRLRLRPRDNNDAPAFGRTYDDITRLRHDEADEFYDELTPAETPADEALVMRQAFAGMLWSKQLYYYNVARWLDGDPTQPEPPASHTNGRNIHWRNFNAFDIMSMPDKWEYPWFATWDMAFHCVALAHVDPAFAKYQLILLCREWFQSPNGALPAYEWDFDDVNPPVQAWAVLEVFAIDGANDLEFLERVFTKMIVNFTWWVNRQDFDGNNLFEGGFLGLDNIGPIDRSDLPVEGRLEQSDATAWMAFYAVHMATIASLLRNHGRPTQDLVTKFIEHFVQIREALENQDLWNDEDGFFYDRLIAPDGSVASVKTRSMVGVLPVLASTVLGDAAVQRITALRKAAASLLELTDEIPLSSRLHGVVRGDKGDRRMLLSVVEFDRIKRILERLFDPDEFLAPQGLRALSKYHLQHPYTINLQGHTARVDYEPAESSTDMFGGNSNWRGPIWMPLNYLLVSTLEGYAGYFGKDETMEYPTGSGEQKTFEEIADDLRERLISIFLIDPDGNRPYTDTRNAVWKDPRWRDNVLYYEYFNGDNGAGLGASHQTGWTGVVADLIIRHRGADIPSITEILDAAIRNYNKR